MSTDLHTPPASFGSGENQGHSYAPEHYDYYCACGTTLQLTRTVTAPGQQHLDIACPLCLTKHKFPVGTVGRGEIHAVGLRFPNFVISLLRRPVRALRQLVRTVVRTTLLVLALPVLVAVFLFVIIAFANLFPALEILIAQLLFVFWIPLLASVVLAIEMWDKLLKMEKRRNDKALSIPAKVIFLRPHDVESDPVEQFDVWDADGNRLFNIDNDLRRVVVNELNWLTKFEFPVRMLAPMEVAYEGGAIEPATDNDWFAKVRTLLESVELAVLIPPGPSRREPRQATKGIAQELNFLLSTDLFPSGTAFCFPTGDTPEFFSRRWKTLLGSDERISSRLSAFPTDCSFTVVALAFHADLSWKCVIEPQSERSMHSLRKALRIVLSDRLPQTADQKTGRVKYFLHLLADTERHLSD